MKRFLIGIGVLGIVFLMVSCATAVPQVHSKPVMNHIEKIEELRSTMDNDLELIQNPDTTGLFDLIIQLIRLMIQFIWELITIIQKITSIVSLIQSLIEAVMLLITYIGQLIELIMSIFNPDMAY